MKKDKPSRRKFKPEIPESKIKDPIKKEEPPSPILEPLMEGFEKAIISSHPLISPFKQLADKLNPFLDSDLVNTLVDDSHEPTGRSLLNSDPVKAIIFSKLILELYSFGLKCMMLLMKKLESNEQIKEDYKALLTDRSEINKYLTKLIPKEATKKVLSHQFVRVCKYSPDILFYWVNGIVGTLKKCRDDAKKRSPRADKTYRDQTALEIFCERVVQKLYDSFVKFNQTVGIKPYWENKEKLLKVISPNNIQDKSRNYSDTYTALKTLSLFANCSYDKLYDLYYKSKKAIKKSNK